MKISEPRGRAVWERDDTDPWDRAVELLLGPAVTESDRARRRADALALSAAAMKAAEKLNHP
ncbi:hypothetical protein KEC55_10775 [Burkholderia cepacia]|uniref:hypothetical protein n=1 Tax=Burkholderia cepacia TaxID=292 RepID=UPI00249E1B79|nr:hypothetical protein [Burkholderia cepacia]WGY67338.1 hypothetical protein KEC55_10775 [Burkholderia cepacia]